MTTVREIIKNHLSSIGASGLCCPGGECGCSINDLAPCCGESLGVCAIDCVPAKEERASEAGDCHEAGDMIFVPLEKP